MITRKPRPVLQSPELPQSPASFAERHQGDLYHQDWTSSFHAYAIVLLACIHIGDFAGFKSRPCDEPGPIARRISR